MISEVCSFFVLDMVGDAPVRGMCRDCFTKRRMKWARDLARKGGGSLGLEGMSLDSS